MAKLFDYLLLFLLIFINLILPSYENIRYGFPPDYLHVNNDNDINLNKPQVIQLKSDFENTIRLKRSASSSSSSVNDGKKNGASSSAATTITATTTPSTAINSMGNNKINAKESSSSIKKSSVIDDFHNQKNITTKINYLNDSHAQLMVHWLGDGTNVMICLAREPPLGPLEDPKTSPPPLPSSVYISYDYGNTFLDKTELFQIKINGTKINSTLDQFVTHPIYNTIVFTDPRNKAIFTNSDYGETIQSHMLDFTPSEVSFYEKDRNIFLVLDKEDPERKLYYTVDFGNTFELLQMNVKSFVWSSGEGLAVHLYVERREPTNSSSVIFTNASSLVKFKIHFNLLIEDVQDFHIKKDFMFATRKVLNNTQLFISYKRGRFVKADFQTELDIKALHIADVEGRRIMVSGVHTAISSHLYVSESNANMTDIKFVPSLDNIFTYIPDVTWKNSWLVQTSDEPFTDLYRVEGLRGIYIASYVRRTPTISKLSTSTISVENLSSTITFDHGNTWNPIVAPPVDDEGQPIICENCSLHLSQKFSQLYPITRSVSIMSSKSAPGVIMATGVVGKSLKGHPCVFISRDAGQTWKQILKTHHFFNYGDHGGVLVAVKYFKSKGETREILYSTDEGDEWKSYEFLSTNLKVYGLMTEPNTNTTIFTLFGSEPNEHRWLIVKIDLKNAFEYNCTADDYKFWSPGSVTGTSIMPCVLGLQETYERRAAHSKCYNGKDYDRPIRTEVCQCGPADFECDFGFSRANNNSPCTRINKTSTLFNPYKIPVPCPPGEFYYRTKGYKLIDGDVCVDGYSSQYLPQQTPCPIGQSNDFLIVAQRDKISRIDIPSGNKQILPLTKLLNVIAIDFDMKHNCVFWADILSDQIGRQCLNGNETAEILLASDLSSVEGMSYDWISELLFFVDGTRLKIEALKTARFQNDKSLMRATIIDKKDLLKPRGIVVHPLQGYLFWTDWSHTRPSISRANLDGSDIRVLFSKPHVVWPNGITIDYSTERVYWVDASKDYIGSCDLHGKTMVTVLKEDRRLAHPFAVGVYKDLIYWDDWKMNSVFSADKDHGIMIKNVAQDMLSLMDLKVFAHAVQSGDNACSSQHNCTHICVGAPQKQFTCLCPDGMIKAPNGDCLCPGAKHSSPNRTCVQMENTCAPGFYTCDNKLCIPSIYRCDTENDCGDNSDEKQCPNVRQPCPPHMFSCKSDSKCIPEYFKCDYDRDCSDGSDEQDCLFEKCKAPMEFTCDNKRCINNKWRCDGEDDCRDGTDEKNCSKDSKNSTDSTKMCKSNEFACTNSTICISEDWRCDGDRDCADGSDENDCSNKKCETWMFACGNGACIYKSWECDGDDDCSNGADEQNCTDKMKIPSTNVPMITCHEWMLKCKNEKCVPHWWKCDGINDCGDNSDELGCPYNVDAKTTPATTTTSNSQIEQSFSICLINEFMCTSGRCISRTDVCDGYADCDDHADELDCHTLNCTLAQFKCHNNGGCLPIEKYCNGIRDCYDNSDEENCKYTSNDTTIDKPIECKIGYFNCFHTCMPLSKICDGKINCFDGSDEENCTTIERFYQINYMYSNFHLLNSSSFTIHWSMPSTIKPLNNNPVFEYLPSISPVNKNVWKNHTKWLSERDHSFINLNPFTTYNVTVYVREKNSKRIAPPYYYINVTTAEIAPTEPVQVKVTQLNNSRVQVNWAPPEYANGIIKEYTVYYRVQSIQIKPIKFVKVNSNELSIVLEANFEPNKTYEFWVRSRNMNFESKYSQTARLTFTDMSSVDGLTNLILKNSGNDFVELKWDPVKNVNGYLITPVLPRPYPNMVSYRTNNTTYKLNNLPADVNILMKVSAYINEYYGRPVTLTHTLPGKSLPVIRPEITKDMHLSWMTPITEIDLKNIVYGIYYGTTLDEFYEKPRLTTKNTSITLDLLPCESYLVGVNILEPNGPGQLSRIPLIVETDVNMDKPPKNLQISIADKTMTLQWEHNCEILKHPSYMINMIELISNNVTKIKLNSITETKAVHKFFNIPNGAIFNVSVLSADSLTAEPISAIVYAPPLPAPHQLKVFLDSNGSYAIFWHPINFTDEPSSYQLLVYPGMNMQKDPIYKRVVAEPPIFVTPDDLGGKSAYGNAFTFGVRLLTDKGYYSQIVETEHIELPAEAWLSAMLPASSSSMWIIFVPILLIISLIIVIVYLVQRHRRLANSFSRFANSHYDTKTGATRIGDALDEDDHHHDTPRFEDDEPLVIA